MTDFQQINGYSNIFWGGGGEDDQFYNRIRAENLTVTKQGELQTANFQSNADREFDALDILQPGKPYMVTEFWSGWVREL